MKYSSSLLLYQDEPVYGLALKLIFTLMPASFLVGGLVLWSEGNMEDSLVLLVSSLVAGFIFWSVFPRRYQIYEDRIRIVLGGPFSFSIGFGNIESVRKTRSYATGINFVTRFAWDYVQILRKKGTSVAITPRDYDTFVENAAAALNDWRSRAAVENAL